MLNVPLSNVQMELLKLYSTNLNKKDLKDLKTILANFFADHAIREADKVWEDKNYTDDKMDKWLNAE